MVTLHEARGYDIMINPENISGIALVPPLARTRVRCFDGEVHLVRESPVKIRALLRAEIQTLSGALDRLY